MDFFDVLFSVSGWTWLLHFVLAPVYLLLGTAKHEYAHAIAGMMSGLTIDEIRITPSRRNGKLYWGYVSWSGGFAGPWVYMAPYVVNLILLVVWTLLIWTWVPMEWWAANSDVFFVATIIGLVLPVVDTAYNLIKGFVRGTGDFGTVFGKTE